MKYKSKVSSKVVSIVSLVSFLGALVIWGVWSFYHPVKPDVFEINSSLEPGAGEFVGTIQKDSPLGEPGTYYLSMDDGTVLSLDSTDLDNLVDQKVTASGSLMTGKNGNPFLIVTSIEAEK